MSFLPPFLKSKKGEEEQDDRNGDEKPKDSSERQEKSFFTNILPPKPPFFSNEKGESGDNNRGQVGEEESGGFTVIPPFLRSKHEKSAVDNADEKGPDNTRNSSFKPASPLTMDSTNANIMYGVLLLFALILLSFLGSLFYAIGGLFYGNTSGFFDRIIRATLNVETVCFFCLFALVAHRFLAYVATFVLRNFILKTAEKKGAFDIHIDWISVRGLLDRNEIVIRNVVWFNPPQYDQTPYLLRIKEVSVAIDLMSLHGVIRHGSTLKIEEIKVDTVEVCLEKPRAVAHADGTKWRGALNVFAAIGQAESKQEEDNFLVKSFGVVLKKVKKKLTRISLPTFSSSNKAEEGEGGEGEDDDSDSDSDSDSGDEDKEDKGGVSSSSKEKKEKEKEKKKPPLKLMIGRLLLFNIVLHIQDLVTYGEHIEPSENTDIKITHLYCDCKQLSGPPSKDSPVPRRAAEGAGSCGSIFSEGEDRTGVTGKALGNKLANQIVTALLKEDKAEIVSMLGVAAANNVTSFIPGLH